MGHTLAEGLAEATALIEQLGGRARPRRDITGTDVPAATFAGRLVVPGETAKDVLGRLPSESPDAEGMGSVATIAAAGATQKLTKAELAQIAREQEVKAAATTTRVTPPAVKEVKVALQTTPATGQTARVIPKEGFVHGAPVTTVEKYLKEGIPLHSTEEGPRLGFLGRLDNPQGYQASMTAVGGFGPRTKASIAVEAHAQVGRERTRESVAYILSPDVQAYPRGVWDSIHDFVGNHPKAVAFWSGRNKATNTELEALYKELRPEIQKEFATRRTPNKSHRFDPEVVVGPETAGQVASPGQIVGIVYDGPLTKIQELMDKAGRKVPVYGPDGNLRMGVGKTTPTSTSATAPLKETIATGVPTIIEGRKAPLAPEDADNAVLIFALHAGDDVGMLGEDLGALCRGDGAGNDDTCVYTACLPYPVDQFRIMFPGRSRRLNDDEGIRSE